MAADGAAAGNAGQTMGIPIVVQSGLVVMPVVGSKEAPRLFDGEPEELEDFLERFEILAIGVQLTPAETVKAITQYMTRRQKELFESLDGHLAKDWVEFEKSLTLVFPSIASEQKYSQMTLQSTSMKAVKTYRSTHADFQAYIRHFMPVAKWLVAKKKITEEDQNRMFWFGIHPDNRVQLKPEMKLHLPRHDITTTWPMDEVMAVAKKIYNLLAFDHQPPPFISLQLVQYKCQGDAKARPL